MSLEYLFRFEGDDTPPDEVEAQLLALRYWVGEAFLFSQEYCPVVSGRLQKSGMTVGDSESESIVYTAPYAYDVEVGRGEPGQKGYFPGRFYVERGINETEELFETYLIQALEGDFDVRET